MIAAPQFLSPQEYLALEAESNVKHEYFSGQAYAMAGASDRHNTVALNLAIELRQHLRGSSCRVFISDMKVRLDQRNRFFYPDLVVTCDRRDQSSDRPADQNSALYKRFPCLVVEVLSDSTEAFDRGDKFADYRTLDSLQEYVLISVKQPRVEVFRRNPEGLWVLYTYEGDPTEFDQVEFELASMAYRGRFYRLYEDVSFEPELESENLLS